MTRIEELIAGLEIFKKYGAIDIGGADHDIIYGISTYSDEAEQLTEEDKEKLQEYGWHFNENCWAFFT